MARQQIKLVLHKDKDQPLPLADLDTSQLPEGDYQVEITKYSPNKTQKQLGAYFGLMIASVIEQANDIGLDTSSFLKEMVREDLPSGIGLTTDFVKEMCYAFCPMYRAGKRITLSRATIEEAARHFDDCCKLFAAHGIYVPEPDKNWNK